MCGRYAFITPAAVFLKSLPALSENYQNYNIAPGQTAPIVINNESIIWQNARWGLIPSWVKKAEDFKARTINARAESLKEKPSFRQSFEKKRCIVPAIGFYEWRKADKQPFFIKPPNGIFAFAGLYEQRKIGSEELYSFSIITTKASETMAEIHNRMPAILTEDEFHDWLNPKFSSDMVAKYLKPYEKEIINYAVDKRVGRVGENDSGLLEPIAIETQAGLF